MNLITIQEAAKWAAIYLKKTISTSNISYLVQYGKVKKYSNNGTTLINLEELKKYYKSYNGEREINWKKKLGEDLNWALSFDNLREKDTTKHVHRLHPYKGKFIPQLVEYFLDEHINTFKKQIFFKKGDAVLDPFAGSGTTLVQANELGIHSIGIEISRFNCMIADVKLTNYNEITLVNDIENIKDKLNDYEENTSIHRFENELLEELRIFNDKYFPGSDFKYKISQEKINEKKYSREKESIFRKKYNNLVKKYKMKLKQDENKSFLDTWYIDNVRKEINYVLNLIKKVRDKNNKKVLSIILSRAVRSCRATTHSDLATLKEPTYTTYYCYKHKKICKPIFSIKKYFNRYADDSIVRILEFKILKTNAYHSTIIGDSRKADIFKKIEKNNFDFYKILQKNKIKGIFSSPPYVGQIDYHEQHAYAYDLFRMERKDKLEIGPLYNGKGVEARESYVDSVAAVLNNCKKYLSNDYHVLLVANDKFNLYPKIGEKAGMKIVNSFKRPVLNRTERDRTPYSEIVFHFKEK